MSTKQSFPLNLTDAADYFEASRNTVAKAVKKHKLKPVKSKGNTHWSELKDLAKCLIRAKNVVRSDQNTFDSQELKRINSAKAEFDGDMKQFHAYEQALIANQRRKSDALLLLPSDSVIAVYGSVFSRVNKVMQKLPTAAEKICPDFTREHAAELESVCRDEVKTLFMEAKELADDAEQRLHDLRGDD